MTKQHQPSEVKNKSEDGNNIKKSSNADELTSSSTRLSLNQTNVVQKLRSFWFEILLLDYLC